jgi:hypothetical protein
MMITAYKNSGYALVEDALAIILITLILAWTWGL